MTNPTSSRLSTERSVGRLLLLNSTVALVLAAMVHPFLHESAHAVAGMALGVRPTIFPGWVRFHPEPDTEGQLVTAAAGPLFSLVFGAVVFALCRNAGHGFVRLLWLWLGLVSMQEFFGYALVAPFVGGGDSVQVLRLLGASQLVYVMTGAAGIAGMCLLARLLAGQVIRYATTGDQLRRTVLFPWRIATAFNALLTLACLLPYDTHRGVGNILLISAGAIATAIFAPMFLMFRRLSAPADPLRLRPPAGPLAVAVVVTLLTVLVVAPGIPVGPPH